MKQYSKFRKHIAKHIVPEGGEVITELDKLRDVLSRLQLYSKELLDHCLENGYVTYDDESEGLYELDLIINEAKEILK